VALVVTDRENKRELLARSAHFRVDAEHIGPRLGDDALASVQAPAQKVFDDRPQDLGGVAGAARAGPSVRVGPEQIVHKSARSEPE